LIELMVVVAIASVLLAIAVPSYMTFIRQSRRTEAKTTVLDLAGREERFLSTNPAAYTQVPANLGYTGAWPIVIGNGYYQVTVCSPAAVACAPNPPAAPSYSILATPVAGQSQVGDALCTSFSVDSSGRQYATGTGGAAVATPYCWAN